MSYVYRWGLFMISMNAKHLTNSAYRLKGSSGSTKTTDDLHVRHLDRDTLSMEGDNVAVFEQLHQVGFCDLLQSIQSLRLPTNLFGREASLDNLAHQSIGTGEKLIN